MLKSIISFGFEDSFKNGFGEGFEEGTAFTGLSEITGCIGDFFLAVGTEVGAGVGITEAVEIFGTVGIVGIAETVARAGTVVAFEIEAFFCVRLDKELSM